ncbi:SpoIIE family protein phosphatase [Stenomitos frigidus]|uniref:Fused response regulator/phosphatase n=1 Tax=Stenomitos frigidus ULC18 TaxID=2107698 RepID=A0A2T1DTW3_9CYAN|nr:SpoIIE family protein phosphatase [Stenomitos frigidus]PSB23937.1 fused response regulator/phosphatase [Stenomitos frigidus ULC18]
MAQGMGIKLKLMVVDDEPDNLALLYRTFRRDFEVIAVESAIAALQILEQQGEMAIIISDQRMPEMLGTEFLSKTVDRYPDTIRIVLTGYTDVEDLVEAINAGKVFKYITKPWNPDQLKGVVQQAAETYQVLKQRTNELRRALRRESLFNAMTTAIRESLAYGSILHTVAKTLGQTFAASHCVLRPVESDRLMSEVFIYQKGTQEQPDGQQALSDTQDDPLIQATLQTRQIQMAPAVSEKGFQLVVPFVYQQEFLAVLSLYRDAIDQPWSVEDIELIQGVADQAALALSQAKLYQRTQDQAEQMRAELAVARQIQGNLLRQSLPDLDGMKVQACCFPAREVGGDFFEVYAHPQGDIWLAVGDVSGKGVPAALFMASAISVLRRELSQESPPEPHLVMQNLNRSLSEDLVSTNCFITMVLVRYNPSTRQLVYANAGHIYPLVWSSRNVAAQVAAEGSSVVEPHYLKVRGVPLGILPNWKAASGRVELNSGEVMLLTSDGITEATIATAGNGSAGTPPTVTSMLQQAGLWQMLMQEHAPLDLSHLLSRIRSHNTIQEDDQTILSLEVL